MKTQVLVTFWIGSTFIESSVVGGVFQFFCVQGSGGFSNILSLAMQRIGPRMWWRIWRKNRNIREDDVESPFVVSMFLLLLFVPLGWQHFHEALHAIWNGIRLVNLITHAFIKKQDTPSFRTFPQFAQQVSFHYHLFATLPPLQGIVLGWVTAWAWPPMLDWHHWSQSSRRGQSKSSFQDNFFWCEFLIIFKWW